MNKNVKKKFIIFVIIFAFVVLGFNYVLRGGKRDIASEKSDFQADSKTISAAFVSNIDLANKKYLDKVIEISGSVTAIKDTIVTIDNNVICTFKIANKSIQKDKKITIKGRFVGYDDLMTELKLDNCFLIEDE
jgi:tRNA_anti-like